MKLGAYCKRFGIASIDGLGMIFRQDNLLHDVMEGKLLGKATRGTNRIELLHDMMEGRDYGQLKDLI